MMLINPFFLLSLFIAQTCAAVVTLYGVSTTDNAISVLGRPIDSIQVDGTTIYSAINPSQGSDVTTYEVKDIRTRAVLFDGIDGSTYTVLPTPTTITYTRVEGQSQLHMTISNAASTPTILPNVQFAFVDYSQNCQFDLDKKQGICAQEFLDPVLNVDTLTVSGTLTTMTVIETQTFSGTYTGVLVPIATITTNAALGRQLSKNSPWAPWFAAALFGTASSLIFSAI